MFRLAYFDSVYLVRALSEKTSTLEMSSVSSRRLSDSLDSSSGYFFDFLKPRTETKSTTHSEKRKFA